MTDGPEGPRPWEPLEPELPAPPSGPAAAQPFPAASTGMVGTGGGDQRTGPLPLHPMTLSDILDGAFKLFKANARTIVLVTAAFVVPLQVIAAFAQRNLLGGRGFLDVARSASEVSVDQRNTAQSVAALVASGLLLLL